MECILGTWKASMSRFSVMLDSVAILEFINFVPSFIVIFDSEATFNFILSLVSRSCLMVKQRSISSILCLVTRRSMYMMVHEGFGVKFSRGSLLPCAHSVPHLRIT